MIHHFFRANEIYENAIVRDLQLFSEREFTKLLQHHQHISFFVWGEQRGGAGDAGKDASAPKKEHVSSNKHDTVKGQTQQSRDAYTRSSAACEVRQSRSGCCQLAVRGAMAREVHFTMIESGENS